MSNKAAVAEKDYMSLKDLEVVLDGKVDANGNGCFILCFWLYLSNNSASLPATILRQKKPDTESSIPFLMLNGDRKMMLFPVHFLGKEVFKLDNPIRLGEVLSTSSPFEIPAEKWVHVGCEVSSDFVRLHLDGDVVGEQSLTSLSKKNSHSESFKKVALPVISGGDRGLHDYVHSVEVMPIASNIKNYYAKDPPVQLCIDYSSVSEIEEDSDGVWSIVGGKASCRRIFSLDVTLLDAFHQHVCKELEVLASLVYANSEVLVENTVDEEAPLLACYDGIEVASSNRPSQLINGRASFKLKIAQLSSKCDNRLFRIRFDIPQMSAFPFLKEFSPSICCISRSRNSRTSSQACKKSPSRISQSHASDDGALDTVPNIVREARPSPSSKRVKLGHKIPQMFKDDIILKRADVISNSHPWPTTEVAVKPNSEFSTLKDSQAKGISLERKLENHDTGESSSASENSEVTDLVVKSIPSNRTTISDSIVFRYCLGDLSERTLLLKEMAISAHEDEILKFADQVSLFSGCSHHRHQIAIAKRLIEEGIKAWNLLSNSNQLIPWETLVAGIREQFMNLAVSSFRSLTPKDFDLLRRISCCQELVAQENFENLWRWLYPVALTLSQDCVNATWKLVTPKWIEGFITKEEAESSLQCPGGLQDPGTFILRFPTSRSWPHPDAGNLVVTYVGSDYMIHHRLLSHDLTYSSHANGMIMKPLYELLLEVPELSRLGRVTRS